MTPEVDRADTLAVLSEQVRWDEAGERPLVGRQEVRTWLDMKSAARELTIHTVITHGTEPNI